MKTSATLALAAAMLALAGCNRSGAQGPATQGTYSTAPGSTEPSSTPSSGPTGVTPSFVVPRTEPNAGISTTPCSASPTTPATATTAPTATPASAPTSPSSVSGDVASDGAAPSEGSTPPSDLARLATRFAPIATTGPSAPSTLTSTPTDPHLAYALDLINQSRAEYGAPPLQLDTTLSNCALRHSQDLYGCAGGKLKNLGTSYPVSTGCAHQDWRNGDHCQARAENQGAAENKDQDLAFKEIHDGMMAEGLPANGSDNHCKNIIDPAATAVGIGLYQDADGILWVTEDFR